MIDSEKATLLQLHNFFTAYSQSEKQAQQQQAQQQLQQQQRQMQSVLQATQQQQAAQASTPVEVKPEPPEVNRIMFIIKLFR